MTSNRKANQEKRKSAYQDLKIHDGLSVYNYGLGYVTSRYISQIRFSHKQRLAEHLRRKARHTTHVDKYTLKRVRSDTNLLPWQ